MNIKSLVLWAIILIAIQMLVIAVVTVKNKDILDSFKATSYAQAIAELAKRRPVAAGIIRFCYAASLAEFLIVLVAKFI